VSHQSKYRKAHKHPDAIGLILAGLAFAVIMLGVFLLHVRAIQYLLSGGK
jgi:hypothetical protein